MSLSATRRLIGSSLLGHPHRSHAAFAQPLHELVGADGGFGGLARGLARLSSGRGRKIRSEGIFVILLECGLLEEAAGFFVPAEQGVDLPSQRGVFAAGFAQVGAALVTG